jgi:hypothetical protein
MMRFSRLGILALLSLTVFFGTSCTYYNRIIARKNLVDGSQAYKERKFQEAERLFRDAVARDPKGETLEGRIAQLFLARTLHSQYIGDRQNKAKAEEAIQEYKKALAVNKDDQASYKAIASLLENLQRNDEWLTWVTERSKNDQILPQHRAEALISLAAKKNTCANDITDTEKTKKTITKDGKQAFQFVKPENPDDLNTLKACIDEGTALIDQALALEPAEAKNAKGIDIKVLDDEKLKETQDLLRVFESGRSYKASLLVQSMRLAEMEGRTEDRDRLKTEADAAKARFLELTEVGKAIQTETEARAAAKEEAANANANANAAR